MDYPPPPPPPDPYVPSASPTPESNVQPVVPPVSYQPYQAPYQPGPYAQPAPYPVYQRRKDKTTAVLLAVFLGFFTWLYTYDKDAWKFWVAVAVTLGDIFLTFVTLGIWAIVAGPVGIGIWIWAMVDAAVRPQQFYDYYPAA
jgi:hypothetical protein